MATPHCRHAGGVVCSVMTWWRTLLLALACLAALGAAPSGPSPAYEDVALETILADPAAFNGRRARVHGFLILQYEGTSLWASEADYLAQRYERAAWLDVEYLPQIVDHPLNGKRVFLSGVIHSEYSWVYGHLGLWPIGITSIAGIAPDPTDTDRARPWLNDPLFVILASLGLLGLVFAMVDWRNRALRAFRSDQFAP